MQERRDWFSDEGTRHGELWGETLIIRRSGSTVRVKPVAGGVEVTSTLRDGTVAQTIVRCTAGICAA